MSCLISEARKILKTESSQNMSEHLALVDNMLSKNLHVRARRDPSHPGMANVLILSFDDEKKWMEAVNMVKYHARDAKYEKGWIAYFGAKQVGEMIQGQAPKNKKNPTYWIGSLIVADPEAYDSDVDDEVLVRTPFPKALR